MQMANGRTLQYFLTLGTVVVQGSPGFDGSFHNETWSTLVVGTHVYYSVWRRATQFPVAGFSGQAYAKLSKNKVFSS